MLSINARDRRPIYEQVYDGIKTLIISGAIAPDEKLPSVRELATNLAINPNTIQRAYRELEAKGIIYTVAGKGAFASPGDAAYASTRSELVARFAESARGLASLGMSQEELIELLIGATSEQSANSSLNEEQRVGDEGGKR